MVSTASRARAGRSPSSSRTATAPATSPASSRSGPGSAGGRGDGCRHQAHGTATVPCGVMPATPPDAAAPSRRRSTCAATPSPARPPAMRRAMAEAEVGDDGFGDDPTVWALEHRYAELTGKEAPCSCRRARWPTRWRCGCSPAAGTLVVAGRRQHVVTHEGGAFGVNQVAQLHVLDDDDGTLDPAEVAHLVEAAATAGRRPRWCASRTPTWPRAGARGRSTGWPPSRRSACPSTSTAPACSTRRWPPAPPSPSGRPATTVTVCLSKGLAAPVGLAARRPGRRHRPGPGRAQAARRRHAPGRHPGRRRAGGARHDGRPPGRGPPPGPRSWPRRWRSAGPTPAATRPRSTRTSCCSATTTRRPCWRRSPPGRGRRHARAPAPCGSSPTTASTTTPSSP